MLEVKNLVKTYGRRTVVDGVSLRVGGGEIVGLLGRNGAGKTTTFRMVVGLIRPNGGSVLFEVDRNLVEITHMPMYRRARTGLGYLSQEPSIFRNLSVEENLLAILETTGLGRKERKARATELLEEFGLAHVAANLACTLSGGERRRLEIARALILQPRLILLDEPFSGVDPIAVSELKKIISKLKAKGIGILLTDHNVRDTLTITDRAYIMLDGTITIQGTPSMIVQDPIARKHYLGEDFTLDLGPRGEGV